MTSSAEPEHQHAQSAGAVSREATGGTETMACVRECVSLNLTGPGSSRLRLAVRKLVHQTRLPNTCTRDRQRAEIARRVRNVRLLAVHVQCATNARSSSSTPTHLNRRLPAPGSLGFRLQSTPLPQQHVCYAAEVPFVLSSSHHHKSPSFLFPKLKT